MASIYETLLPRLQAIYEEGGNMVSHFFSRPILDMVDAGAVTDPGPKRIRRKILDAVEGHKHKRDHRGFSQIFEAYSEAVVYLGMRSRGLQIRVVPEVSSKTPDFETESHPVIGFELKTVDANRPTEVYDAAMDQGFESAYEALEEARASAQESPLGVGVGISASVFNPHGEGAGPKEAVSQTIRKLRGLVKAGQYEHQPTLLVTSLVRIGVAQDSTELCRWQPEDQDFGGRANGHLYTIAAHQVDDPFYGYDNKLEPGPYNLGALGEAGILRDHPFIAGLVFVETAWDQTASPDVIAQGIRFNGIWNTEWEKASRFTAEQKAEAKRIFLQLCHAWNDTEDSQCLSDPLRTPLEDK